jgi:hypothetical protein
MTKIIRSSNYETKKPRLANKSMLLVLSKLPLEIISNYPHNSLYRCFSNYIRKKPDIILNAQESKYIYHKWRVNEAERRKILRNQKINISSHTCEKKYFCKSLNKELKYCYNMNPPKEENHYKETNYHKAHKYQEEDCHKEENNHYENNMNDFQNKNTKIQIINEQKINEENLKKKYIDQIKEIEKDISYYFSNDYDITNHYETLNDYELMNDNEIMIDYEDMKDYEVMNDYEDMNDYDKNNFHHTKFPLLY